jgi:hypothetical protein
MYRILIKQARLEQTLAGIDSGHALSEVSPDETLSRPEAIGPEHWSEPVSILQTDLFFSDTRCRGLESSFAALAKHIN